MTTSPLRAPAGVAANPGVAGAPSPAGIVISRPCIRAAYRGIIADDMNLDGQRLSGRLDLRYEDVTQDGRVQLETMPVALGALWKNLMGDAEVRKALREAGIIPILTRYELEGGAGPFAVDKPIQVEGGFALAHSVGEDGQVARIHLDLDAELRGPKGRTNLPRPEDAGKRALVGRVRAEHVFTRPFAPAEERRVVSLPVGAEPGAAVVPKTLRAFRAAKETIETPPGARSLEPEILDDPARLVMGLAHTDSNQHVNSLVYPRLFEDAALRRMEALGLPTGVLARKLDIAFRRPSFAGEVLKVAVRTFEHEGRIVTVGAFFGPESRDIGRARVYAQMTFE